MGDLLSMVKDYDVTIIIVAHLEYRDLNPEKIT
jgi:UDP-N-acetyl-D-mannosaminuronate dehydrogenase